MNLINKLDVILLNAKTLYVHTTLTAVTMNGTVFALTKQMVIRIVKVLASNLIPYLDVLIKPAKILYAHMILIVVTINGMEYVLMKLTTI